MQTSEGNRLDGCQFAAPSPADYRLEFADRGLPRRVDISGKCTGVEDQGAIGSCTANACVGALEYAYTTRDGAAPELSRMFVYYNTRRLKGMIEQDTGATISEAMGAVLAYGACEAGLWPYDPRLFMHEPPPQAYANAKLHEAIQYARVPGPNGAIHAVAQGYPVVYGTFLPKRCYEEAARTGVVPRTRPEERTGPPAGGHCMLIVGYDLDREIFIVRNSWGEGWGNGGYCEIPFEEMAHFSPPESFWTMLELEPPGHFSVVKPAAGDTAPRAAGSRAGAMRAEIRARLGADLERARSDIRATAQDLRARITGAAGTARTAGFARQTECTMCQGVGTCWYCKGSGTNMGYPCNACANGVCSVCGGSGSA